MTRPYGTAPLADGRMAYERNAARPLNPPRLLAAAKNVLIDGNHLALLIGADHPPYSAEPLAALEHYGVGDTYEIWCAWRSVMQLRDAIDNFAGDA